MQRGHGIRLLFAGAFVVALLANTTFTVAAEQPSTAIALPLSSAVSPRSGRFEVRTLTDADGPHKYTVYFPPGYTTDRRWPVILFLHGAGERGTDGYTPTYAGLGPLLRHSPELYPCVVVFPQCETWDDPIFASWSIKSGAGRRALAILDEVELTESIDPAHRSLTGWSMGAFGATAVAAYDPTRWQAVLPIAGGYRGKDVEPLQQVSLWMIHGTEDKLVSVDHSRKLATRLGLPQGRSRYDELDGSGHEIWEQAYSDPRVAKYLIEGGPPSEIDWTIAPSPAQLPTDAEKLPFIPVATVSKAVVLRIGNDALRMLTAGIPETVKPEKLRGTLPDIHQSFTLDGETYDVVLSELTYAVRLDSAELTCLATADIRTSLGMSLDLRVGAASLTTRGFAAKAAPFRIVIGHRRPVPLQVLVKPRVQNQQLKLTLQETRFPIPDDDWYVEMPSDIQITGNKFTRHEIETGIVGGLYTRKTEVEKQVRSVIPGLLKNVEQQLNRDTPMPVTRWLWPFPFFQPRLRWNAESLLVDAQGMTISLGAVVCASYAGNPGDRIRDRTGTARLPVDRQHSPQLHLAVDPLFMEVVSEEFATSGIARINVLDLPEARFHAFAKPERLHAVLPGLPLEAELRTVLALGRPFQIQGEPTPSGSGGTFRLNFPAARLEVFSRMPPEAPWSRAGQFSIALDQSIQISLERTPTGPPLVGLRWDDAPRVQFTTADQVDPQGLQDLERAFQEAWVKWGQSQVREPTPAEDVVVGDSRVRIDRVVIEPRSIVVDLVCPMAHLTVAGHAPLTYRVRSRDSFWSRPRTLAPGKSHRYEVHDPVEWEVIGVPGETYTLRPGEVAQWDLEAGVTYDPPRQKTEATSATSGETNAAR
jgi:poly(3-hydroxybutyrate) depolymerase